MAKADADKVRVKAADVVKAAVKARAEDKVKLARVAADKAALVVRVARGLVAHRR